MIRKIDSFIFIKYEDDYPTVCYIVDRVKYTYRLKIHQNPTLLKEENCRFFHNPNNPEKSLINNLLLKK